MDVSEELWQSSEDQKERDLQALEDISQHLLFLSNKLSSVELRLDAQGGNSWDVLRHLSQHFTEFDPAQGGSALFTEFLCQKRWSLISGPVSQWQLTEPCSHLSVILLSLFC